MSAEEIRIKLREMADPERAGKLQRYFKTGSGEYGEGDKFIGIKVPQLRALAKKYKNICEDEAVKLLKSEIHEERLISLFLLIQNFKSGNEQCREKIYGTYLNHTSFINNWDLVDTSAGHIVGAYLAVRDRVPLYKLAHSKSLWERRIAIISTSFFIGKNDFRDALKISEILLGDKEDLIHKAVGWMLREIGKRDIVAEKNFLYENYKTMPRTTLRYAIEKFPKVERNAYLKGEV